MIDDCFSLNLSRRENLYLLFSIISVSTIEKIRSLVKISNTLKDLEFILASLF